MNSAAGDPETALPSPPAFPTSCARGQGRMPRGPLVPCTFHTLVNTGRPSKSAHPYPSLQELTALVLFLSPCPCSPSPTPGRRKLSTSHTITTPTVKNKLNQNTVFTGLTSNSLPESSKHVGEEQCIPPSVFSSNWPPLPVNTFSSASVTMFPKHLPSPQLV